MSSPNLETFNERVDQAMKILPPNATVESVNYDCHTTVMGEIFQTTASVLIIYSTPIEA